jgi:hypothetical protein
MLETICGQSVIDRPTIQRIDSLIQQFLAEAVRTHPDNELRQDRHLRDRIIEDIAPEEASVVAMQCDHYLLCLRLNAQVTH